jgi:hypothetical protein
MFPPYLRGDFGLKLMLSYLKNLLLEILMPTHIRHFTITLLSDVGLLVILAPSKLTNLTSNFLHDSIRKLGRGELVQL